MRARRQQGSPLSAFRSSVEPKRQARQHLFVGGKNLCRADPSRTPTPSPQQRSPLPAFRSSAEPKQKARQPLFVGGGKNRRWAIMRTEWGKGRYYRVQMILCPCVKTKQHGHSKITAKSVGRLRGKIRETIYRSVLRKKTPRLYLEKSSPDEVIARALPARKPHLRCKIGESQDTKHAKSFIAAERGDEISFCFSTASNGYGYWVGARLRAVTAGKFSRGPSRGPDEYHLQQIWIVAGRFSRGPTFVPLPSWLAADPPAFGG